MNQSKGQATLSNQRTAIKPRSEARLSFFGGGGGGGGSTGWQEVTFAQGTAVGQGYGITYAASPVSGFAHRLTIDTNSSTSYLSKSVAAYVYFDTGQTLASLSSLQSLVLSCRIETSIDPSDVIITETTADYQIGAFIANDVPNSATMGVWSGMYVNHQLATPRLFGLTQGGFDADTTIASGGSTLSGFDVAADLYEGPLELVQPRQEGTNAAPTLGIMRAMTSHYYEDTSASKSVVANNNTFQRAGFGGIVGTGSLHIGGMFAQVVRTGATSKTLDFNVRYLIASQ